MSDKAKCVRCGKEIDPLKDFHTCKQPAPSGSSTWPWMNLVPHFDQRQDSLSAQLEDLVVVANKLGMKDAATWLSDQIREESLNGS